MGVMDEVCITLLEGDVFILPLALFHRPLVHGVNISERSRLDFSDVSFLGPACFSGKVWPTEYGLNLTLMLYLRCFVLWSGPPSINAILKVPAIDELFNFILQHNKLLCSVTNVLMVSAILILVPLGVVSTQWVRSFEYLSLLYSHEDVFSR